MNGLHQDKGPTMDNPYELVPIKINDKETYGRPVRFDSEPVDMHTLKNKEGRVIRPSLLTSACPDCGQGLEVDLGPDDHILGVSITCNLCKDKKDIQVGNKRRFRPNDPNIVSPRLCEPNLMAVDTTVADRIDLVGILDQAAGVAKAGFTPPAGPASPEPVVWTPPDQARTESSNHPDNHPDNHPRKRAKSKKKRSDSVNTQQDGNKDTLVTEEFKSNVPSVTDISEEMDIDDTDMIEAE